MSNIHREKIISKIYQNRKYLSDILNKFHSNKKKILVKGVYDLFHTGHLNSFINARQYGDILIVAVNSDIAVKKRKGMDRPIINQENRMTIIAALECVDFVVLYEEESPYSLIKELQPNVFAASHFKSLNDEQRQEICEFVHLQQIPKIGNISSTIIIDKLKHI